MSLEQEFTILEAQIMEFLKNKDAIALQKMRSRGVEYHGKLEGLNTFAKAEPDNPHFVQIRQRIETLASHLLQTVFNITPEAKP